MIAQSVGASIDLQKLYEMNLEDIHDLKLDIIDLKVSSSADHTNLNNVINSIEQIKKKQELNSEKLSNLKDDIIQMKVVIDNINKMIIWTTKAIFAVIAFFVSKYGYDFLKPILEVFQR
jgi:KaiC/GvpD/RAD55 family RecA-like ATPase